MGYLITFIFGSAFGVGIMCLMQVGTPDDDEIELEAYKRMMDKVAEEMDDE